MKINKNMIGQEWPFIPEEVEITKEGEALIITHNKKKYGLNGVALSNYKCKQLDKIWKNDSKKLKMSLNPIFALTKRLL